MTQPNAAASKRHADAWATLHALRGISQHLRTDDECDTPANQRAARAADRHAERLSDGAIDEAPARARAASAVCGELEDGHHRFAEWTYGKLKNAEHGRATYRRKQHGRRQRWLRANARRPPLQAPTCYVNAP